MEQVNIFFKFGDPYQIWTPYYQAIDRMDKLLAETGKGHRDSEDMSTDAGDVDIDFTGESAEALFDTILPVLKELPFMRGARVTFKSDEPESETSQRQFVLEF